MVRATAPGGSLPLMLMLLAVPAFAEEAAAPGPLGAGVIVGSPTGLSAKWSAGQNAALDAALGLGFGNAVHLHADWLYEGKPLLEESGATLSWFTGVGGKLAIRDRDDRGNGVNGNGHDDDDLDLGPRVPAGLELRFTSVPALEIFAELAIGIEVADDQGIFLDGGLGVRWFF